MAEFVATVGNLLASADTTTGKMDHHVSEFYGMTSKVLGDLGGLALQFDRHGKELADVVNTIEKSNLNVASSVAERKQAIEGLVSIVDERTEELDGRLKRFTSLLYQALHAAEDRARDVARLLVDATAEGARAVAEQHAAIRSTTEQQSAQTLESLQIVFDQVSSESKKLFQKNSSEAHQLLQQATDRFTDVMQAMKQMSLDMQNELDKTRQEMRRGVLELPEEAAASTAQMRRVIVDQMEALAELNRIVARHGRAMDTVTTGSEPPAAKRAHRDEQPAMTAAPVDRSSGGNPAEMQGGASQRGRVNSPPVVPVSQAPTRSVGSTSGFQR